MSTRDLGRKIILGSVWVVAITFLGCAPADSGSGAPAGTEPAPGFADATTDALSPAELLGRANVPRRALVKIKIKINDDDSCRLEVGPRGVGACKSPQNDCNNFVTWRWIGDKHGYDEIRIDQKANSPLEDCFDLADGNLITDTGRKGELVKDVQTGAGECDTGSRTYGLWSYKVTATHPDPAKNCYKDPGVIIDN